MGTILASQSLAAAASVTSNPFAFAAQDVVDCVCTNGATPPNIGCQAVLMLSVDGATYYSVDRRSFGKAANQAYHQTFVLADYLAPNPGGAPSALGQANSATPWQYFKVEFLGNDSQAVTVAATDTATLMIATVTLAGTTSTSGGGIASWAPPGGNAIIVDRVIADITTKSTGAANLTVGFGSSATGSYSNLIAATAVGSAAVCIDSITTQIIAATAAESGIANLAPKVPGADFITVTGSADTTGMVGTLYIRYIKP